MKNRFKILTAFLFGFIIFGNSKIFAQFFILHDRAIISGYVFEESNGNPIPYVNVYVKRTRYGTITDTSGHFIISAKLNDTIVFSVLGFDKKYIIINDSAKDNSNPLILFLNTKIYELKSVDIIALRKYKQLEYEIKNMKLPDDAYTNALRNFPFRPPDIDYYARGTNPSFGLIFNPITADRKSVV